MSLTADWTVWTPDEHRKKQTDSSPLLNNFPQDRLQQTGDGKIRNSAKVLVEASRRAPNSFSRQSCMACGIITLVTY